MIPKPIKCKASIAEITGIVDFKVGEKFYFIRKYLLPTEWVNHSRWLASFNAKCRNEEKKFQTERKAK